MTEAHIRIDEGIKRPKYRHKPPKSPKYDLGTWVIPKDLNPRDVIERYMTEETTSQIAAQYGLSRKALTKWLRSELPHEWKQAQILRALCRKEDADEAMDAACDALSLARTREQLRSAQFDLQALDEDYRPKQEVSLTVDLGSALQRIIENRQVRQVETTTNSGQVIDATQQPDENST